MLKLLLLTISFSLTASATTDLGKPLTYKTHSGGKPHVGIAYTYGNDPDGPSYFFSYLPAVSTTEAKRKLRWNFYAQSTDKFLLDWDAKRSLEIGVLQAQIEGAKNAGIIETILKNQNIGLKSEVFFILADDKNVPVYNISISKLCDEVPGVFSDLTYSRSCDDAKL